MKRLEKESRNKVEQRRGGQMGEKQKEINSEEEKALLTLRIAN
jgi:hypothetical protein